MIIFLFLTKFKISVGRFLVEVLSGNAGDMTDSQAFGFDILYEEGALLAVNKPSGLLTQAPVGIDSLEFRVKDYLIQRDSKTGNCYLGIPHRLDRPASGVILFTLNSRMANKVSQQFRERSVQKIYWAVAQGTIEEDQGTWYDFMRKIPGQPESEIVSPMHPDAREAILKFKVLKRWESKTWLQIELETGRTHQIRLQCATRNFPLLGDAQYGSTVSFGTSYEDIRKRAIALHSRKMTFENPQTKETVVLTAPLSSDWNKIGIEE